MLRVAIIVEGDGETEAVPVLLRRIADRCGFSGKVEIVNKLRIPAGRLIKQDELERAVELSARKLGGLGGIFILLDSEDDCPAVLGPALGGRARGARPDLPVSLVLAYREYEAWFLGSASTLAGKRNLRSDLLDHSEPERPRGCKEWLTDQMPIGKAYQETDDQPALTAMFDLDRARVACSSFDKCWREAESLFRKLDDLAKQSSR
jgi:hypothetical protein